MFDLTDLTKGEAQLNTLIDKRAEQAKAEGERWREEAAYRQAEREAEAARRRRLREQWFVRHLKQADRVERSAASIAHEHRAAAERLARAAKAAGVPLSETPAVEFRQQAKEKQRKKEER